MVWQCLTQSVFAVLQVGLRYGLPLLSPVDDAGCFTAEAGPRFAGEHTAALLHTSVFAVCTAVTLYGACTTANDISRRLLDASRSDPCAFVWCC